jgi:hypothetical protein
MLNKTLITLTVVAAFGMSSAAIARGGGGGGGMSGGGHSGHGGFGGHFSHHFDHFGHRFQRNQVFLGGWGLGWPYGDTGYGNTTVVAFPQAVPEAANVTGSISSGPCHWNQETFTVPSSAGGTRPIQVVSCQ